MISTNNIKLCEEDKEKEGKKREGEKETKDGAKERNEKEGKTQVLKK